LTGEVTIDAVHALSAIGQASENVRDRKKEQQVEYARQLQMQQRAKLDADDRGDARSSSRSARRAPNGADAYGGYPAAAPHAGDGAVSAFGADPATEAARKREMQQKYRHQLQEQQRGQVRDSGGMGGSCAHHSLTPITLPICTPLFTCFCTGALHG